MKAMFILPMSFGVQVHTIVASGKEEVATNIFQNFIYKKVLHPPPFTFKNDPTCLGSKKYIA